MPYTFLAGRKLRMWGNSYRFSKISDTMQLNRMADTIDVTVHENDDRAFISSLRTGGAQWGGIMDASSQHADEIIAGQLGTTAPNVWTVAMEGDGVGKLAHLYRTREKQVNINAPANGRIGVSMQEDAVDHILNGNMLIQGTASFTTTGARASVDNAAASALGGVGHFHCTDTLAALTSVTAKIQHSSAGASWADLLTFTTTSTGFSHQETTGLAVKRFTRGVITAVGGGTPVFMAVAFARKTA